MEIHIGNRVADVTLVNKDGNHVELTIDGKPCTVDIVMAENGSCSILHDGNVVDTQAKYLRMRKGADEEQSDKITAPMPGKVVSIPVGVGDELRAGDIAIVLEAMKMQSNYKVSADCRVKAILVAEGDAVQDNQTLIELELKKEG